MLSFSVHLKFSSIASFMFSTVHPVLVSKYDKLIPRYYCNHIQYSKSSFIIRSASTWITLAGLGLLLQNSKL